MTLKTILVTVFGLLAFLVSAQVALAGDYSVSCPFQPTANRAVINFNAELVWGKSVTESFKNVTLPAGTYKVYGLAYDGYDKRVEISQANERFFVELRNGSTVVARSGFSQDLQDRVRNAKWNGLMDSNLVVSQGITVVGVRHANYISTGSGSDSVTAGCIALERVTPPAENLTATCSANPNSVTVGGTINWSVNVSGGSNYSYNWSGTDGLSGSNNNISKSYSSAGTKNATVIVNSGSQSVTANCSGNVTQNQTNSLIVSCRVDDSSPEIDEEVTWSANASGGTGSYSYDWDGSEDLHGSGRTVDWDYDNDGRKTATVTVTSGSQTASATCSLNVEDEEDDLEVSCYANPSNPRVGETVRWYADVEGGDGDYDYDWSGDDGLKSSRSSPSITYYDTGEKEAKVKVRSNGQTATDTCDVNVRGNSVLAFSQSNPNVVLDAVYLNQVPYTGLSDHMGLIWFILSLLGVSAYISYVIVANQKRS